MNFNAHFEEANQTLSLATMFAMAEKEREIRNLQKEIEDLKIRLREAEGQKCKSLPTDSYNSATITTTYQSPLKI